MSVLMIKKRLANGEPCRKCAQAEDLLRRRGLWSQITEVVVADEERPSSPGMALAREHGVEVAPFFIVDRDGQRRVYTSVLKLISQELAPEGASRPGASGTIDLGELARETLGRTPQEIVGRALDLFGGDCVIAFSGAEDVVLLDMAARTGRPFGVLSLDTGRLHPETYRFIDRARAHFGVEIEITAPDTRELEALVRKKGLFSFYSDGHGECCGIRKVGPLKRVLAKYRAWMTGQRRDQSPTRSAVAVVDLDHGHSGRDRQLVKWNPLAEWSLTDVWSYIREHDLPYNPLHDQGFVSIGCEPCTRPVRPGEHERAGRWWWEEATKRECGLHVKT